MKLTKERLKQIIKEELKEVQQWDVTPEEMSKTMSGVFGGEGWNIAKTKWPAEYEEADRKGLLPAYKKVLEMMPSDRSVPLPAFLQHLDGYKQKYPEAFSDTSPTPPASGQKAYSTQRAAESLAKMNTALRSMDPTFKKDPDLRIKYENALAAVSALHFAISGRGN